MLERLGYQVETEITSLKALERFHSKPDRFDLVITDMTMLYMTGDKLVKEILRIRQDIPTILCTDFSEKSQKKGHGAWYQFLLFHIPDSNLNFLLILKQFQKFRGVCVAKMIGV